MGSAARRRVARFVPWVALAAVTVFAVAQLDRGESSRGDAASTTPTPTPTSADTAPARATEQALDDALRDLEEVRGRARSLEGERDRARTRAEAAEAELAAARARLGAFDETLDGAETAVGDLEGALEEAGERIRSLEARREAAEDTVLRWLRDAAAENPDQQAQARQGVERAGAEDLERLARLVEEEPGRAAVAARLLGHVEPGDAADAAARAVLLAPDAAEVAGERIRNVGPRHAVRAAVLEGVLEKGAPDVRRALLAFLAAHTALVPEEAREPVAAVLIAHLDPSDARSATDVARSLGMMRAAGAAKQLAALLDQEDGGLRAAAAYALSRVPDLEEVKAAATRAVVVLLADASLAVRTAGVLLAESLVGEAIAFDPAGDAEERERALEALRLRMS